MTAAEGERQPEKPSRPRRASVLAGRVGPVRKALRAAVEEAREAKRMTPELEVRALLADRYAAMVDRATSAGDGADLLRAGDKLLALMASLPIRVETKPPVGGESGGGDGGRGGFLELVDGEPEVGDAANA